MMKVTILGGNGFVGHALAEQLARCGHDVAALVRPDFDLLRKETFHLIPLDTEILVHAAGLLGDDHDPDSLWKTNGDSAWFLAHHLNAYPRLSRFVYLSSGAVYAPSQGRITLKSPLKPATIYGCTKLMAERILECRCKVPLLVLRLFFPFGPGQNSARFLPGLVEKVRTGKTVQVNPDGGPFLNPITIDELTGKIARMIQKQEQGVRNLGGEVAVGVGWLVDSVGKMVGRKPIKEIRALPANNCCCCAAARSEFLQRFEKELQAMVDSQMGRPGSARPLRQQYP